MESRDSQLSPLPPPPGAVNALVNGFNAIAGNVGVILLPAALDVFLWLGPRLKADVLFTPILQTLLEIQAQIPPEQLKRFTQVVTDAYNGFNLFSFFRTYPLGVFSLMSVNIAVESPLGERPAMNVPDLLIVFGLFFLVSFVGWMLGSLYFHSVARVVFKKESAPGLFHSLLHGGLLSGALMLLFSIANLPLLIILWVLSFIDSAVRTVLLILLTIPLSWVILTTFFSFHGIFADGQNAFAAARSGVRLLRYALPPMGWFAMLALLINQGMDLLWRVPPADSWMLGIGILGHAFVSTSLLAASFIYYRDLNIWVDAALQWIKKQNITSARA